MGNYSNGAGGGAGHGGRGGSGFFNGRLSEGGQRYGRADFPCELGSGSEGPGQSNGPVIGGGIIGKKFYLVIILESVHLFVLVIICFMVADELAHIPLHFFPSNLQIPFYLFFLSF